MNGVALGADSPLPRVAIVGHAQHNQFPAIFAMFDAGAKQNMFFLCAETGSIDLNRQRGQASDISNHGVAADHRCHAFRCAAEYEVTRLKLPGGRQMLNGFCNIPNQLADMAADSI